MTSGEKTEFQRKAAELSACAYEIIRCLETHDGTPHQIEYGKDLAQGLRKWVAAYDIAIFEVKSREAAADALSEMNRVVHGAGQASEKGDMRFKWGSAMNTYHDLHTIFREARYRSEPL